MPFSSVLLHSEQLKESIDEALYLYIYSYCFYLIFLENKHLPYPNRETMPIEPLKL